MEKIAPTVTPAGVPGAHVNAMEICRRLPQAQYPTGSFLS
jgi:tryptophanase